MCFLLIAVVALTVFQLTQPFSDTLTKGRFQITTKSMCISSSTLCDGCQFCPPPGGELCPNACVPGAAACPYCPHSNQPTIVRQLYLEPTHKPHKPSTKPFAFSTQQPVNKKPTGGPLLTPAQQQLNKPSFGPTQMPLHCPTEQPSLYPTSLPQTQSSKPQYPSILPWVSPSFEPSLLPSLFPSTEPTVTPTMEPSVQPSDDPSTEPSVIPSWGPSIAPTSHLTTEPSCKPSVISTESPTCIPSAKPSSLPPISSQPAVSVLTSNSNTILTDTVLITLIASIGAVVTIVCGIVLTRQLISQADKEAKDYQEGENSDKLSYQHPSGSNKSFKLLSNPLQNSSNLIEMKNGSQSQSTHTPAYAKAEFNERMEASAKVLSNSSKSSKSFFLLSLDSSIFHSGASNVSVPRHRDGQANNQGGDSINQSQTRSVSNLFRSFNFNVGSTKSIFSRQYFTTASRSILKQSSLITKSSDLNASASTGSNLNLSGSHRDGNMLETTSSRSHRLSVKSAERAARTLSHRRRVEATFALNATYSLRDQL